MATTHIPDDAVPNLYNLLIAVVKTAKQDVRQRRLSVNQRIEAYDFLCALYRQTLDRNDWTAHSPIGQAHH